ncbi:hypothetical protein [Streptomyces sp. NPDC031705]|uniref:hypothetical protein n=1 Tax=Streptomyces sp. NPDC031705 TaxID=3155729 RepID=UPI0033C9FB9B
MQDGLGLTPGQAAAGFVAASLGETGTALTTLVLLTHISAGARGPAVTTAFATGLRYVVGTLLTMWALMLLLPKRAHAG